MDNEIDHRTILENNIKTSEPYILPVRKDRRKEIKALEAEVVKDFLEKYKKKEL